MARAWIFQIDFKGTISTQNIEYYIPSELGEAKFSISAIIFYTGLQWQKLQAVLYFLGILSTNADLLFQMEYNQD
jgi:hypothetical protein